MKILVTGVSGFIGGKICSILNERGHHVIGLDKDRMEVNNIIEFYEVDIADINSLRRLSLENIDIIIHAAAQSGGFRSLKEPVIDFDWNARGTFNMVMLAQELRIKKFIYLSSMAVYGNNLSITEDSKLSPISFYGVSKLTGEFYVKLLEVHDNVPTIILRLFATYGAGQDLTNTHQGILSIYLKQALDSDTVKITGASDRIRELVHVNDVVKVILKGSETDELNGQIFNVTNGQKVTPKIIIEEIGKQLGKKLDILEIEGYRGDQTHVATSGVNKLSEYNLMPQLDLPSGINEFLSCIKKN